MSPMPRPHTLELLSRAHDLDIAGHLRQWREETPPATYLEIAYRLRDKGLTVTPSTIRRWCFELEEAAHQAEGAS